MLVKPMDLLPLGLVRVPTGACDAPPISPCPVGATFTGCGRLLYGTGEARVSGLADPGTAKTNVEGNRVGSIP